MQLGRPADRQGAIEGAVLHRRQCHSGGFLAADLIGLGGYERPAPLHAAARQRLGLWPFGRPRQFVREELCKELAAVTFVKYQCFA